MDVTSYLLGKKSGGGGSSSELGTFTFYDTVHTISATNVTGVSNIYVGDNTLKGFTKLTNVSNIKIYPGETSVSHLFENCTSLEVAPMIDLTNATHCNYMFQSCTSLTTVPLYDLSNIEYCGSMFRSCSALVNVPAFNLASINIMTNLENMFKGCSSLSNESLNNILKTCISAKNVSGTKNLSTLGFSSTLYPASTIQALPDYQNFLNAGWTIGY